MKVLAIDPGYDRLGIAVLEKKNSKEVALFSTCVTTDKRLPHSERLVHIGREVREAIVIAAKWVLDALAGWTILVGNLLAAGVMLGYFLRGHRALTRRLASAWADDD